MVETTKDQKVFEYKSFYVWLVFVLTCQKRMLQKLGLTALKQLSGAIKWIVYLGQAVAKTSQSCN